MAEGSGWIGDLAPRDAVVAALKRGAIVVVGVGLLAGLVAHVLSSTADDAEASARLGLTDEVVWPFYDQVRDELSVAIDEPNLRDRVSDAVGGRPFDLQVEAPIGQTYLDVVATADDRDTAIAASDAAAEAMVERSRGTEGTAQETQLESVTEELRQVDQRIEELSAAIGGSFASTLAVGESTDSGASVARQQLQLQRSNWSAELDELIRERVQLDADARQLRRELESGQPDAQIVRRAAPIGDERGSVARPFVAGLGAAGLAAIAVLVLDRYRGRIRGRWYVESAGGVELIADLRDEDDAGAGAAELADRLEDAVLQNDDALLRGRTVGVMTVSSNRFSATEILSEALGAADPAVPATMPGFERERTVARITVVPISKELDRADRKRARSCAGLLIVVAEGDRVNDLRTVASRVRQLPAPLLGAVLIGEPTRDRRRADEHTTDQRDAPPVDAPSM